MTIPGIYIFVQYKGGDITYGQTIIQSGDWSVGLLILTLAVTPIRKVLPKAKISSWLMKHRRAFGVASFGYAALHTFVYLERKWGFGYIQEEAQNLDLLTGWIAFVIFVILAITSNNSSVRALRKNWQHLHRTVYIATGLTFAHWVLTSIEPRMAYICLGVLCLIEGLRFIKWKRAA